MRKVDNLGDYSIMVCELVKMVYKYVDNDKCGYIEEL